MPPARRKTISVLVTPATFRQRPRQVKIPMSSSIDRFGRIQFCRPWWSDMSRQLGGSRMPSTAAVRFHQFRRCVRRRLAAAIFFTEPHPAAGKER